MDQGSLGKRLRSCRAKCGLNIVECSELADISEKYLSDIERGAKVPRLETFVRLLNALSASADDVLQDSLLVGYVPKSNALSKRLDSLDATHRRQALEIFEVVIESLGKRR